MIMSLMSFAFVGFVKVRIQRNYIRCLTDNFSWNDSGCSSYAISIKLKIFIIVYYNITLMSFTRFHDDPASAEAFRRGKSTRTIYFQHARCNGWFKSTILSDPHIRLQKRAGALSEQCEP